MIGNRTVCLSMIVRDEEPVIRRCLASARPFIDSWVVCDTGSGDGTPEVVFHALDGVPGQLLRHPWVDFAANRNRALDPALAAADYALILDADEWLESEVGFAPPDLDADSYALTLRRGTGQAISRRLLKRGRHWAWVGVLHEHPACPGPTVDRALPGLIVRTEGGGARSRDPRTRAKDLATLRAAIEADPGNARHRFFLAQTAHDGGRYEEAARDWGAFLAVATDREDIFHARLLLARCLERTGRDWPAVQDAYMAAWAADPARPEPCAHLGEHYLAAGDVAIAAVFLRHAYACPFPSHARLPVDLRLHRVVIPMQHAFACAKLGRPEEALAVTGRLLAAADLDPGARAELRRNQDALLAAMGR